MSSETTLTDAQRRVLAHLPKDGSFAVMSVDWRRSMKRWQKLWCLLNEQVTGQILQNLAKDKQKLGVGRCCLDHVEGTAVKETVPYPVVKRGSSG